MACKKHPATRRPRLPASQEPPQNPSSPPPQRPQNPSSPPPQPPQNPSSPLPQPPPIAGRGVFYDIRDPGPDVDPVIREHCSRAVACLSRGSVEEGFEIIYRSSSHHPNNLVVFRTLAIMHFMAAGFNNQHRVGHLQDCVASAEKAFALCPNLIGFRAIYALSLFYLAKSKADYENVIKQCEKALSIQDPVDPGKDIVLFQPETEREDRITKEGRIRSAKRELRVLIQQSNEAAMKAETEMEEGSREKDDAAAEKKKSDAQSVSGDEMWEPFVISRKCQEVKRLAIEKELDKVRVCQHEIYKGLVANNQDGYLGRFGSMLAMKILVLQYWRGLSREERRAFLKVDVKQLEKFYISDKFLSEILKETVGFLKELRSWKFWECNICEQRFLDGEFWMCHLENHFWVLSLEDRGILPDELDDAWMNKIVSGDWKPVDVDKMLKHITEEAKAKQEVGHDVAGESEMDIDENKWSYCDDAKRKGLLDRICSMFHLILRNSCLSQSKVQRWLRLTRFQLEKKCPDVREMFPDLENTPLGICFLESDQLEMLYRMTCEIYKHCQMLALSKDDRFYDDVPREDEYRETIDYTDDFSFLLLDERFLTGEFKPENCSYLKDEEFFVHWLYGGAAIEELANSWAGVRAQKLEIADSAYQFICQELELLRSLCKKKLWLSTYERAFQVVRNMCFPENRWETMPSHEPQNLVRLLRLQQDIITKILGGAQAAFAGSLGSEGPLFDVDAQESDFGAREDEEKWMQAELCVLEAIELKRNDIERKFCIVDGLIMKSLADIKRMKQNFSLSTAHDFRTIMLHLLKSFIRAWLENFASKDAEEKAKAAEKALLNVLGLDSKKKNEDEKATNVGKKSKKKKAFYKRYPKDKKTSGSEETVELEKGKTEVSFPIPSSDESRKLERQMLTAEIVEDEQLMRLIESEGMTPEEMIESQRRIEEDIEQNRLEEQNKEVNETDSEDVEDEDPLVTSTGEAEEPSVSEPPQHSQTVTNPVDSILIGTIPVRLFPRPGDGDGSSTRNLLLPTESHTKPGETNVPAELMQAEQSEPITLPGTGAAEVGDSLPRAENDGLDDTEIVCGEDENVPDLEVGVQIPDVDAFNEPDLSYVYEYRGYSSA